MRAHVGGALFSVRRWIFGREAANARRMCIMRPVARSACFHWGEESIVCTAVVGGCLVFRGVLEVGVLDAVWIDWCVCLVMDDAEFCFIRFSNFSRF